MAPNTVFYAWQAQLPARCNRSFIESALEQAIKELAVDAKDPIELYLDQDARGAIGSPEISTTILRKIEGCSIFVADVTPVGVLVSSQLTPNPNVMFELGFAWCRLGEERVILVLNEAYGSPEALPFDIGRRCLVRYRFEDTSADKPAEHRPLLSKQFRALLSSMMRDEGLHLLRKEGLSDSDIGLFKRVYAQMVEANQSTCNYEVVLELGRECGLSDTEVDDACQIIRDRDLWKAPGVVGPRRYVHVRATARGWECYCNASLAGYSSLRSGVSEHLLKGIKNGSELAAILAQPDVVIDHVLQQLEADDYIQLSKTTGGSRVLALKPKLKRLGTPS